MHLHNASVGLKKDVLLTVEKLLYIQIPDMPVDGVAVDRDKLHEQPMLLQQINI